MVSIISARQQIIDALADSPSGLDTTKIHSIISQLLKSIDYKDEKFLLQFVNEQGKILPRRYTGTSLKYQRKVSAAIKRARHLALMPYVADLLK